MRKTFLCGAVLVLSSFALEAQSLTNYERRCLNDKLLEAVISYENYISSSEPALFLDLFEKSGSKVYCDYVGAAEFGKQIAVSEYAGYLSQVRFVEVRNLRKSSDYLFENGRYVVSVEFDKCLEYEDELKTYFTTDDKYIGGEFYIAMNLVYDADEDRFRISSIEGNSHPKIKLPEGEFFVVERNDAMDDKLMVLGKPLDFNEFGSAYTVSEPVVEDEDIILTRNEIGSTGRYRKVNYSYKETKGRFKVTASAAPLSAYKLTSPVDFSNVTSAAYESSLDFGYTIVSEPRSKLAVFAGIGGSYSFLSLGVENVAYEYELSDVESETYTRRYSFGSVREGMSFMDVMLPLYFSYELSLDGRAAFSLDAGVKLYLNVDTRVDPYTVEGLVSSVYGSEVRHTEQISAPVDEYMIPASYMRNTYDMAAFGKLGFEYRLKDRRYLFLKAGYLYGLTESYKSSLNEWIDPSWGVYPFVYSSTAGKDVAVRSFADCISYRRSALTFDFGFRMKF